jgi:hypothetical protein
LVRKIRQRTVRNSGQYLTGNAGQYLSGYDFTNEYKTPNALTAEGAPNILVNQDFSAPNLYMANILN